MSEISNKFSGFSLPRSADLPDLDFYMDQVVSIMEKKLHILSNDEEDKFITSSMINNYVKLGLIPPPVKKRYTKEHLCYLFIICTLKSVIPIPAVSKIIETEIKGRSVYQLYDIFCEAYENMLNQANSAAEEIAEEGADKEAVAAKLALFMAINASTTQLVANDALAALMEKEPEEEKKEKKEKKEKTKEKKEKASKE